MMTSSGGRPWGRIFAIVGYIVLIVWAAGQVMPLLFLMVNSVRSNGEIVREPLGLPSSIHLENYVEMLFGGGLYQPMGRYLLNSIVITGLSLTLLMAVSALAAYALARYEFPGRGTIHRILLLTIAVPAHALLIPVFVMMGVIGLRNSYVGISLLYAALWTPFTIVILRSYFESFPSEIEDAGRVDGCSEIGLFWRIVAPMSRGAIASLAIVNFIAVWSELLFSFILLNQPQSQTINVGLLSYSSQYVTEHRLIYPAMAVAAAPTLLFYLLFARQITKGMSVGAFR